MPFLAAALAAALWLIPAATAPALAHHAKAAEHVDAYAMKKKAKKVKKPKAKKEEYMKAAPYK
jgi:hypothetical protein